jgi:hypothetical protein
MAAALSGHATPNAAGASGRFGRTRPLRSCGCRSRVSAASIRCRVIYISQGSQLGDCGGRRCKPRRPAVVVFFILCVAILNLGLGYGLALYLHGHGGTFHLPSGFGLPGRLRSLWPGRDPDEDIDEPADAAPPQAREQRLPPIGEAAAARLPSANESKVFTSLAVELPAAKTPAASAAPQAPAPSDAAIGTALAAIAPATTATTATVDTSPLEA